MLLRPPLPKFLAVGLAAGSLALGLLTTQATAAPHPGQSPAAHAQATTAVAKPSGADTGPSTELPAARSKPLPAALRGAPADVAPAASPARTPRSKPATTGRAEPKRAPAAVTSCTTADFAGRTGAALVAYIKTVDWHTCINPLFDLTGANANAVFKESQMLAVANGFAGTAASYTGDDSGGLHELLYFLRAGYYVQSLHPADVGTYDSTLTSAVGSGFTTLFNSSHSNDVSAGNGDILEQAFVTSDSAQIQGSLLGVYKRYLTAYSSAWDAYPAMDRALNAIYTPLWRGPGITDFVTAVTADPSIADTLYTFTLNHRDLLGGDNDVLDSNAGNDLAHLVQIPALQGRIRPLIKGLMDASSITGPTASLWVHVAYRADNDDAAQCSYYGVCDLAAQLTRASLPISYGCGNFTIMAQSLTAAQQSDVCNSLKGEVPYYHSLVKDNGPIPGEYFNVKMVIYGSKADYATYSWAIFGNSTDNGGETLTGNPTDPKNVAYSILYQKPSDDGFPANAWNLNHEFAHILQSIYDMKGDFGTQISVPDVWWIEGQAEYVSYSYRGITDDGAIAEAAKHTYKLSDLWQNTYAIDDVTRTYPWGYLAVRYMTEKHPSDIQAILAKFRTGDYSGAYAIYNTTIGTRYDADFDAWLTDLARGGGGSSATACTDSNTQAMGQNCYRANQSAAAGDTDYLWIYLPAGTTTLKVTTSGGTGNADLYYNPTTWAGPSAYTDKSTNSGNTESISVTNTAAGYRYISLYAATSFSGVTVTTTY
ncbi:collagenase [Streptomyces broussonetiae]|uniref:microbial collagenase n=3 Tax=Streptomyces broussonetiae TaxID=2686304 RepID=A0A6I6MXM6_9ACTN|nr:M9 family metallopeptidase [Streptomyces broussonetiae]QHA02380.1 collagenase [Streptomyces broussonetiae]